MIVRLVGAGYGTFAPRWNENPGKDNPRGLSLHSRRARPQSPSFRRRPESGTGARGGKRAFPVNPCAGSAPDAQGEVATCPYGIFARRRRPGEGQPQGVVPTPRPVPSPGPRNGAQECAPCGRGGNGSVGAAPPRGGPTIREPPVFRRVHIVGGAGRSRTTPTGEMREGHAGGCPYDSRRGIADPRNGAQEWKRSRVSPTKPSPPPP